MQKGRRNYCLRFAQVLYQENIGLPLPPMKNVIQSEGGVKTMRGAKDPVEVTQNVLAVHASSIAP